MCFPQKDSTSEYPPTEQGTRVAEEPQATPPPKKKRSRRTRIHIFFSDQLNSMGARASANVQLGGQGTGAGSGTGGF